MSAGGRSATISRVRLPRFGPFSGLPTAAEQIPPDAAGLGDNVDLLPAGPAVLGMLAWIGATFAAGAALLRRRDVQ